MGNGAGWDQWPRSRHGAGWDQTWNLRQVTALEFTPVKRERLLSCAAGAIPGFLAGIHLTGLLFFLNPHLPFSPAPVFRTSAYYGALGALGTMAVLLPVSWKTPARAWRLLPWCMAGVFGAAACLDLAHAYLYDHFLPPGIHDRLVKAGLWLVLAAAVTLYTALLHSYRRQRPYGARSRFGIGSLAVLTVYSVFERREAFEPPPPREPRAAAIESRPPPNLLVLGLDGASLDAILPLSEQGLLPFFSETMRSGSYGRAESIEPVSRLPLWTTVVTGKHPFRHGVVSEETRGAPLLRGQRFHLAPRAIGFGVWGDRGAAEGGPPTLSSAPALWQIAEGFGIDVFALDFGVGLTESAGARAAALGTAMEDERLARLGGGPPSAIYTAALRDLETQTRLLEILESRSRDDSGLVVFAVMDGLAAVSHLYYNSYHAVLFDGDQKQVRVDQARWFSSYYAFVDGLLAEAWEQLPPPRMLAVVSAYGWRRSGPFRRLFGLRAGAIGGVGVFQNTPDGLLLLRGPGINEDRFLTRLGIQDVAPTLLYALNLPTALDMDGRVITEAFETSTLARRPIAFVPSYETRNGAAREP